MHRNGTSNRLTRPHGHGPELREDQCRDSFSIDLQAHRFLHGEGSHLVPEYVLKKQHLPGYTDERTVTAGSFVRIFDSSGTSFCVKLD